MLILDDAYKKIIFDIKQKQSDYFDIKCHLKDYKTAEKD
jgi:hypothetical protein|tara:strand:+ start:575 stop:691 length:117 start_codon:yes stop_codon:yes gene_type:complete